MITYRDRWVPDLAQARELYRASTLAERRPVEDDARFAAMLANANLTITAWEGDLLVGISRALSDFVYATYLSDLAVRVSHQHRGIGKEMIRRTRAEAPRANLILLAAPAAQGYYPHIGFAHQAQAWMLREGDALA